MVTPTAYTPHWCHGQEVLAARHGRPRIGTHFHRHDAVGSPGTQAAGAPRVRRSRRRHARGTVGTLVAGRPAGSRRLRAQRHPHEPADVGRQRRGQPGPRRRLRQGHQEALRPAGVLVREPEGVVRRHVRSVGLFLLLVAPLAARASPAVGQSRHPSLEPALQPVDRPTTAMAGVSHVRDLRPDAVARDAGASHRQGGAAQPALPVLDPHRSRSTSSRSR